MADKPNDPRAIPPLRSPAHSTEAARPVEAEREMRPTAEEEGTISDPPSPPPRDPTEHPAKPVAALNEQPQTRSDPNEGVRTSGRFRLEEKHTWPGDILLEADTIVGDGTEYPLYPGFKPSVQMTEVTDEPRPRQVPRGVPGQGGRRQ